MGLLQETMEAARLVPRKMPLNNSAIFIKEGTFWFGRDVALCRKNLMVIPGGRVNKRVVLQPT